MDHYLLDKLTSADVREHPGSFNDLDLVYTALEGVYGVFVNTDSFAHGEEHEMYLGMRIFELAKQISTVRHYTWSNIDSYYKVSSPIPTYIYTDKAD